MRLRLTEAKTRDPDTAAPTWTVTGPNGSVAYAAASGDREWPRWTVTGPAGAISCDIVDVDQIDVTPDAWADSDLLRTCVREVHVYAEDDDDWAVFANLRRQYRVLLGDSR